MGCVDEYKSYQGIALEITYILSKKNGAFLSKRDRQRNQKIAAHRNTVEDYFGRET